MEPPTKKARSAVPGVGVGGSGKAAPVLPWMRVPITIDPGSGTPVEQIYGLDERLRAALLAGKETGRRGRDGIGDPRAWRSLPHGTSASLLCTEQLWHVRVWQLQGSRHLQGPLHMVLHGP